ncbi:deoxynucleoside kinase [Vulgatibacter sp.]|uniref:deoxynucleoside kinase n=1 Tax=Vulgatibacter sp. TaxID=1971226 RepID=UPI0035616A7A
MERARYIVVEGPIGVGKSTLTQLLADRFGGRTVFEVVDENPFLPLFYKDRDKHAFQTQLFFLLSRFKQQQELFQQDLFNQVTVSDYLFAKDRIFASLTLNPAEMALYDRVFDLLRPRVVRPDLVIYLQARLDVLLARIKRRGRAFEAGFDADYLARLCSTYNDYFFHYDETPLLVINSSDIDLVDIEGDKDAIVDLVRRHKKGVQHYIPRGSAA